MDDQNTETVNETNAVTETSEPEPQTNDQFPSGRLATDDLGKDLGSLLGDLLEETAKEIGRELRGDMKSVRAYAAQRMAHLATGIGEPGYTEALKAERDAILLKAAGKAVKNADAVDRRFHMIVETALTIGSRALMVV